MIVLSRRWFLTACTFVACLRGTSCVTGPFPIRNVRASSKISVKELSTFGMANRKHHSKNEAEQIMTASARAIPDSREAREGKTVSLDQLEALRKQHESIAKSIDAHLSIGSTRLASNSPKALDQVQRGSQTNAAHVGLLQQTPVSGKSESVGVLLDSTIMSHFLEVPKTDMQKPMLPKSSEMPVKDQKLQATRQEINPDGIVIAASELQQAEEDMNKEESGGVLLGSTINSHVMRVPKEMRKPVLPKNSEMLVKDRKPQTTRQEIDPDGTAIAFPLQQEEEEEELQASAQILPNGQSRTLLRFERKPTSQVGALELGGAENDEGLSVQAPQTPAAQQAPAHQATAPVVGTTRGTLAAPTSAPPDYRQALAFLGLLRSIVVFIALLAAASAVAAFAAADVIYCSGALP